MSAKERDRLKVLHEVRKRHITQKQAGVEMAIGVLPALVSGLFGSFGVQGIDNGCGVELDHCKERPSRGFGLAPMGFPILYVVETEAKRVGELGLSEAETLANGLYIHLAGKSGLVALGFPFEVAFDLIKPVHQFVKCVGHNSSLPVRVKNVVCAFLKVVSFLLSKVRFLVLRKDRSAA
jgi:hypothetical protein